MPGAMIDEVDYFVADFVDHAKAVWSSTERRRCETPGRAERIHRVDVLGSTEGESPRRQAQRKTRTPERVGAIHDSFFWGIHIGGVKPSRPAVTRTAVSLPSRFCAVTMASAPTTISDRSAGLSVTIGTPSGTTIVFSPSL